MSKSYDSSSIRILDDIQHVRLRPGMYICGTGIEGLHHLLWEILDNSIDEYVEGHCSEIKTSVQGSYVVVQDNGRGVPFDIHKETGVSTLTSIVTQAKSGGKFDTSTYKVSSGLHGVGTTVVSALSSDFKITSQRGLKGYSVSTQKGLLVKEEKLKFSESSSGTRVEFTPDFTVLENNKLDIDLIKSRLTDLSMLCPGLKLSLDFNGQSFDFYSENGLIDWVMQNGAVDPSTIQLSSDEPYSRTTLALGYIRGGASTNIVTFINNVNTKSGGSHLNSFKKILKTSILEAGKKIGRMSYDEMDISDYMDGLCAAIDLKVQEPKFEGQAKHKFYSSSMEVFFKDLQEELVEYFTTTGLPSLEVIIDNYRAKQRAKSGLKRSTRSKINLNGKLWDCSSSQRHKCELFIVEGNSAAGSCKNVRDSQFQAILPLRGKVLNVERGSVDKIENNVEITALIQSIGCLSKSDLSDIRYGKIIIATDADSDGQHIESLLISVFYKFLKPVVEAGYLYVIRSPLYRLTNAKESVYLNSKEDLETFNSKGFTITRFKGLGELSSSDAYSTLMNPTTRFLKKISIDDGIRASKTVNQLFGSDSEFRRDLFDT